MNRDNPKPEKTLRIYTERETVIGFFDGMYYYDQTGRMLRAVNSWEYVYAPKESF